MFKPDDLIICKDPYASFATMSGCYLVVKIDHKGHLWIKAEENTPSVPDYEAFHFSRFDLADKYDLIIEELIRNKVNLI